LLSIIEQNSECQQTVVKHTNNVLREKPIQWFLNSYMQPNRWTNTMMVTYKFSVAFDYEHVKIL